MELIIEVILEMTIQLVGQAVTDLFGIRMTKVVSIVAGSLLAAMFALALAGITIAVHSEPIIRDFEARLAALFLLPLISGLTVAWIGRKLSAAGKSRSGFEYFMPAFVFSLLFGLTRWFSQK